MFFRPHGPCAAAGIGRRALGRVDRLVGCTGKRGKRCLEFFLQRLQLLDVGINLCHFGVEFVLNVRASELTSQKLRQYRADFSQ
jgi:hypothetical protein